MEDAAWQDLVAGGGDSNDPTPSTEPGPPHTPLVLHLLPTNTLPRRVFWFPWGAIRFATSLKCQELTTSNQPLAIVSNSAENSGQREDDVHQRECKRVCVRVLDLLLVCALYKTHQRVMQFITRNKVQQQLRIHPPLKIAPKKCKCVAPWSVIGCLAELYSSICVCVRAYFYSIFFIQKSKDSPQTIKLLSDSFDW